MDEKKKTALGIDENLEGALSYLLGLITGILFLILEKENKFVRFHAMQSILVSVAAMIILTVIGTILLFIPVIGWVIGMLLNLGALVLWLFLMFKAYNGEIYKLSIFGDFAEKQIK